MKVHLFPFSILCAILFISSCQLFPQNTGKLVVTNQSELDFLFFTQVWTRKADTNEWLLQWHRDTSDNTAATMYLTPGKYDIRVRVEGLLTYKDFETGYKHPVRVIENEVKFLVFDGKGIYDMELQ